MWSGDQSPKRGSDPEGKEKQPKHEAGRQLTACWMPHPVVQTILQGKLVCRWGEATALVPDFDFLALALERFEPVGEVVLQIFIFIGPAMHKM